MFEWFSPAGLAEFAHLAALGAASMSFQSGFNYSPGTKSSSAAQARTPAHTAPKWPTNAPAQYDPARLEALARSAKTLGSPLNVELPTADPVASALAGKQSAERPPQTQTTVPEGFHKLRLRRTKMHLDSLHERLDRLMYGESSVPALLQMARQRQKEDKIVDPLVPKIDRAAYGEMFENMPQRATKTSTGTGAHKGSPVSPAPPVPSRKPQVHGNGIIPHIISEAKDEFNRRKDQRYPSAPQAGQLGAGLGVPI